MISFKSIIKYKRNKLSFSIIISTIEYILVIDTCTYFSSVIMKIQISILFQPNDDEMNLYLWNIKKIQCHLKWHYFNWSNFCYKMLILYCGIISCSELREICIRIQERIKYNLHIFGIVKMESYKSTSVLSKLYMIGLFVSMMLMTTTGQSTNNSLISKSVEVT